MMDPIAEILSRLTALEEAAADTGHFSSVWCGNGHRKFTRAAYAVYERLTADQREWLLVRLAETNRMFICASDVRTLSVVPEPVTTT